MQGTTARTVGLGLVLMLAGAWPTSEINAQTRSFDGTWNVSLYCPNEPGPRGALQYTYSFPAQIAGGIFRGEHGSPGAPGWLLLEGTIRSDGSAVFEARGLTGQPPQTHNNYQGGMPYAYHMTARFEGAQGTGVRTETRACTATFTRQ